VLVPMIVARSGAELGNNEWLEKLQCSSGVPMIVKSVPLRSVATGKCTNDCGTERSEIAHLFPVNIAPRMLKERSGE